MLNLTAASVDATRTRDERHAEIVHAAAKTADGFEYRRVSLSEDPHAEVWRCEKPGSSNYAHDVAITRYGIAVFGDMDPLVFSVGAAYGMKFLAGEDVDYYIHSKLSSICKDTELDPVRVEWVLATCIKQVLDEHWEEADVPAGAVTAARDQLNDQVARGSPVPRTLDGLLHAMDTTADPAWRQLPPASQPRVLADLLARLVSDVRMPNNPHEVRDALLEHEDDLNCSFRDLFDDGLNLTRPSFNLLVRLHVVNIGARRILELQAEQQAHEGTSVSSAERQRA
jgi:hypothetical protein